MNKLLSLVSVTVLLLSFSAKADNRSFKTNQELETKSSIVRIAANDDKQTKTKPPASRGNSKSKSPNAGLRSDGELVQAKKSQKLVKYEPTLVRQQQGRVLLSSDISSATGKKKKAALSQISTEPLDNSHRTVKPIRIRASLGAKCNKLTFPKHAVIEKFGKQQAVECGKGDVVLKRGTTYLRAGVLAPIDPKLPKKKIKGTRLGDEMPEDLPAN